jgi:hypothetical protein
MAVAFCGIDLQAFEYPAPNAKRQKLTLRRLRFAVVPGAQLRASFEAAPKPKP